MCSLSTQGKGGLLNPQPRNETAGPLLGGLHTSSFLFVWLLLPWGKTFMTLDPLVDSVGLLHGTRLNWSYIWKEIGGVLCLIFGPLAEV